MDISWPFLMACTSTCLTTKRERPTRASLQARYRVCRVHIVSRRVDVARGPSMRNAFQQLVLVLILSSATTFDAALRAADPVDSPPAGLAAGDMDATCKPCSDFYHYANG